MKDEESRRFESDHFFFSALLLDRLPVAMSLRRAVISVVSLTAACGIGYGVMSAFSPSEEKAIVRV